MKILLRSFSLLAGVILVLISAFNIPTPVWGVQVDLTVSTDRSFYNPGDLVKISGSLKVEGKPVEGALVALEVRDPLDNAAFVDQPASGQDGVFGSKFALRPDAPPGTYQVFASYLGKVATSQFSVGTPTSTQTATPSPTPTETPKPLPFSDLEGHWAYQYISELFSRGIVNGYPDGTFKPDRNVTRAEFCKLIVCTISIPLETEDLAKFTDLGTDHWAFKYIQTA
ncbi:MAG: S-layer homology domain-containing protein, partial [Thermofilum sp.]